MYCKFYFYINFRIKINAYTIFLVLYLGELYSYVYFIFKIIYNLIGGDTMKVKDLTILEKVGQKFIFGVNSHNIDVIINLIKKYHIGGVILYKKNYRNYDEMVSVIKRLKEANKDNKIPLFISIDQEGGRVNRMPSEIKNIKNLYDVSKVSSDLVYESAKLTGKMLKSGGINMNFSPVIDIYDKKNKALYKRCFHSDISLNGKKYVSGLKENDVISVIKHFPGHGSSRMDSHFITPYVFDYKGILDKHIVPFEEIIKSGVDAVMLGHLTIRKLTYGLPASISSKFIFKYLKENNKFRGLIITDEINMLSRNLLYRFIYLKKAFLSGSDIILVKLNNSGVSMIEKCIKYALKNIDLLDESVERIINFKKKYNITDGEFEGINIELLNDEIDKLNNMV